jgi:hypothetical protein
LVVSAARISGIPRGPRRTDPWSTPVNLGTAINTADFDGGPAISFDGTALYFFSNRAGGSGGNDLYVTTRARVR